MSYNLFEKDPDARLLYGFDWSDWLASGETITSASITTDLTYETPNILSSGSVVVWISGGTAGLRYPVACKIQTSGPSGSAIDERTIKIDIKNR